MSRHMIAGTVITPEMPLDTALPAIACSNADYDTSGVNENCKVDYAAVEGMKHAITGVAWSYVGGTPTGSLKINEDGHSVFYIDITSAGAGIIAFPLPKKSSAANQPMQIILGAGGTGITGKLSVLNHYLIQEE